MIEISETAYRDHLVVNAAAYALVENVVKKHNIKSYEDFTCKHMRNLAKSIEYFEYKKKLSNE